MKYYKATDSRGNEWATSRSNPDRVVRYLNLLSHIPYASWTASPNKDDYIVEVQTNIVEIDAKEYRAIMKKRETAIDELVNSTKEQEAMDDIEAEEPTEDSDMSWIEDLAEKQYFEEKITLRLTLEQLSKLTIQTNSLLTGDSAYDPIVSEGVMDMLREKRHETIVKQMAFRAFCEICAEQLDTDNVDDAKKLLKIGKNKQILNDLLKEYKETLAAN